MSNETTILLYALSMIAQTVAALAAFVGAVGLYRLQLLITSHERTEDTIKGIMAARISREKSIGEVIDEACAILAASATVPEKDQLLDKTQRDRLAKSLTKWRGFISRYNRGQRWLIAFEIWNLAVILGSILAFNFVERIAGASASAWLIGIAMTITAAITVGCVYQWSGD